MSNKTVAILLILLIALSGFTIIRRTQAKNKPQETTRISSIRSAFESGMSLECNHQEKDGSVRIFIRDGSLRYDNTLPSFKENARHFIYQNGVIHVWHITHGAIFRDVSKHDYDKIAPAFVPLDEALASIEAYKDSCGISRFDNNMFGTPTDISFIDTKTDEQAALLPEEFE